MGNKTLYPATCTRCGASRGFKRKSRTMSLCRPCSFLQSSETKIAKNNAKFIDAGFPADIKRVIESDGRINARFKISCPSCGLDKGYGRKSSINADCFKCSAIKSGIKNRGLVPPNKGISASEESKIKVSCTKQGIDLKDFNGFITPINEFLRTQPIVRSLRKDVFKRDGFTCQCCQIKGSKLNAHHLNGWKHYPNERYLIENLITLCEICHIKYHGLYGKGTSNSKPPNTKEQFFNFKEDHGKKENEKC